MSLIDTIAPHVIYSTTTETRNLSPPQWGVTTQVMALNGVVIPQILQGIDL